MSKRISGSGKCHEEKKIGSYDGQWPARKKTALQVGLSEKGSLWNSCMNQDPHFKKGLPRPTSGVRMSQAEVIARPRS